MGGLAGAGSTPAVVALHGRELPGQIGHSAPGGGGGAAVPTRPVEEPGTPVTRATFGSSKSLHSSGATEGAKAKSTQPGVAVHRSQQAL